MYKNVGGITRSDLIGPGSSGLATINAQPQVQPQPYLPGVDAHKALRERTDTGNAFVDTSGDHNDVLKRLIDYSADPRNTPDYYTGNTVAGFGGDSTLAHEGYRGAADKYDALTGNLLDEYTGQLDPNSQINQDLGRSAATAVQGQQFGTGARGGFRSDLAQQSASQDAIRDNRQNALDNISNLRSDLTGGSDILSKLGSQLDQKDQDIINEDIKRFNYAQLSPQQQLDRILSLVTAKKGLEEGNVGVDYGQAGSGSKGIFGDLASSLGSSLGSSLISSLFNGGGMVGYKQEGGPIDPMMNDPMAAPGAPVDPMMGNQPPVDPMAPGMDPMAPAPAPEMGMGMEDPMMSDPMMAEMTMEPQSEIDKVESAVESLIASTGAPLTITRKTIIGKKKKGK